MKAPLLCLAFAATSHLIAAESALSPPTGQLTTPGWSYTELRRFKAPEAGQAPGPARDERVVYVWAP